MVHEWSFHFNSLTLEPVRWALWWKCAIQWPVAADWCMEDSMETEQEVPVAADWIMEDSMETSSVTIQEVPIAAD